MVVRDFTALISSMQALFYSFNTIGKQGGRKSFQSKRIHFET